MSISSHLKRYLGRETEQPQGCTLSLYREDFNPGQWSLLNAQEPFALLAGGVGSGKTTGLCATLIKNRRVNWGTPGLLVAPTGPMLKGVTLREFMRVYRCSFPQMPHPRIRDWTGDRYLDFCDAGAPMFLRTASRPESIEGFSVGWAGIDEARWCPEAAYRNTISRVRLRCRLPQTALASTPAIGWLSDEFNAGKVGRRLINAPTRENIRNLRPGYIEDLMVSFSPRIARAILNGEFIPLEGVVFDAFDAQPDSAWITDWAPTMQELQHMRVYLAVDPGWRRSAWLFIVEIRPLEWVVFDELILNNTSDVQAVEIVNQRGYPIDEIWVDPAAEANQSATGLDTRRVLNHVTTRDPNRRAVRLISQIYRDISWGVDKTRVLLGGYDGFPTRIRFSSRLLDIERGKERGILRDLSMLRYAAIKEGRPISDTPLDDGITSHFTDAFRYFCVGRVLTVPQLRMRDPVLMRDKNLGYRLAA